MATSPQDGFDPTLAQTPEDFMRLLRLARAASGLSLVEIAERARQRGYDLDPVDLNRALERPNLPGWQTVTGILAACGLTGMQIDRWMRVYHDLAEQPVDLAVAVTAVQERIKVVEPISVPPLVLTATAAAKPRFAPRHVALAAGALVILVLAPLLFLFGPFKGGPDPFAASTTSSPPRTIAVLPEVSPSDQLVELPSPTATPTSPAPSVPGVKPAPRPNSPTPAPPSPTPSPKPPSPTEPIVFRSGTATLTTGSRGFNVDGGQTSGAQDIYRINSETLSRGPNESRLKRMSGQPSKQTCQAEAAWQDSVDTLRVGQWLCVRTSDNRFGRLRIAEIGNNLRVEYTVWS